ncbi:MerR family DNA-binding protein [Pseudonocardia sp. MCCB 268]|nr:MerR family DNA-binding protein [Pseudonocardia cytotoxica]
MLHWRRWGCAGKASAGGAQPLRPRRSLPGGGDPRAKEAGFALEDIRAMLEAGDPAVWHAAPLRQRHELAERIARLQASQGPD